MSAIILTFDRLPLGFLGFHGNSWIATPNFDRLASRSSVFEQHLAECLDWRAAASAWWNARYLRQVEAEPHAPVLRAIADRGVRVRIIREAEAAPFHAPIPTEWIETVEGKLGLDATADDTPIAHLAARARHVLRHELLARDEPWLLWVHSRGVRIPWTPPRFFARRYLDLTDEEGDEEDEENSLEMSDEELDRFVESLSSLPRGRKARAAVTAVERRLMRTVLAGYVTLIDDTIGPLLQQIEAIQVESPVLLAVTSAQGVAVREAGDLARSARKLSDEVLHVPLLLRTGGSGEIGRRQMLTQPVDVAATLLEWFGEQRHSAEDGRSLLPAIRGEVDVVRERAFVWDAHGARGLRTADRYLVLPAVKDGRPSTALLFNKPGDVWDVFDVASQQPETVEALSRELTEFFTPTAEPAT